MEHAAHVEVHAERRARDLNGTSLRQRFLVVKSLIPKKTGCGSSLAILADGCIASNKSEEARGFAGHFSAAFGGFLEPVVQLAERARLGLSSGIAKARGIITDALIVPGELDLRRTFARMNLAKTIGEACIGPELCKCALAEMARLYHPVAVKAVLWLRSPILWKCGQVHPLKKKATSRRLPEFRDIRLEDPGSKAMGTLSRPHLLPIAEAATPNTQYGSGLHGGGT